MKTEQMGDFPRIPDGLKNDCMNNEDKLNENVEKRSGKFKSVRHRVKEMLKDILKNKQ